MPYRYLEEVATADVAFEAWGEYLEDAFIAAADATVNLMVENLDSICRVEERELEAEDAAEDLLLFQVLQELIFLKDAYQLLMRIDSVDIRRESDRIKFTCKAYGELIDPQKHGLAVDVKAVTFHNLSLKKTSQGWRAHVVLDI